MLIVQVFRRSQILSRGFHRYSEFEYNLNRRSTSSTNNSFSKEKYENDYIHDDYVIDDYDNHNCNTEF
jgi:hypothetical protein